MSSAGPSHCQRGSLMSSLPYDVAYRPDAEPATSNQVVVIGASAGGLDALRTLLQGLPLSFPAPLIVVLHRTARHGELLSRVLTRGSTLVVRDAVEGQLLQPGTVSVAPADSHLHITSDRRI